jgi:hypothetical protein
MKVKEGWQGRLKVVGIVLGVTLAVLFGLLWLQILFFAACVNPLVHVW